MGSRAGRSTFERWAEKVPDRDDPETCWEWRASKTNGYGMLRVGGMPIGAHRVAYEHFVGPIPSGFQVDHRCRNRGCVNPRHLRLVTQKQNLEHLGQDRRNNTSGFRGVYEDKRDHKWFARVVHNGVVHHGGRFDTPEAANIAAVAMRNRLFTHNDPDRVANSHS